MKRKAFTLIELLVVIGVISILMTILLPALQRAREQARNVKCLANMRAMGQGYTLYLVENNQKDLDSGAGGGTFWFTQLAPYMGASGYADDPETYLEGSMRVIWCPSTKAPPEGGNWGNAHQRWRYHVAGFPAQGSYALNTWVGGWGFEPQIAGNYMTAQDVKDHSLRNVSARMAEDLGMFADGIWVGFIPMRLNPVPSNLETGGTDTGLGRICVDRHNMAINVTYADGHAAPVQLENLWKVRWSKGWTPREVTIDGR